MKPFLLKLTIIAAFILCVILAMGVLFLNIPAGQRILVKEIKAKTGKELTYRRLYPTGWNSFSLYGVRMEGLVSYELESVRGEVEVAESLRMRRPVIRSCAIQSPVVEVQMEDVVAMLKKMGAAARAQVNTASVVEKPPSVENARKNSAEAALSSRAGVAGDGVSSTSKATVPPEGPPRVENGKERDTVKGGAVSPAVVHKNATKQRKEGERPMIGAKGADKTPSAPSPQPIRRARTVQSNRLGVLELLRLVEVSGGELHFHSLHYPRYKLSLDGVSFIPEKEGSSTLGVLKVARARIAGQEIELNIEQPVLLEGNELKLPEVVHDIAGLQVSFPIVISVTQGGGCKGEFKLMQGAPSQFSPASLPRASVRSEQAMAIIQFQGFLQNLASMQVVGMGRMKGAMLGYQGIGEHSFHDAYTEFRLLNGVLSVPVAHFRSDGLSLIGNGVASLPGQLNAVLRVVVSPEWRTSYKRLMSGLMQPHISQVMRELETPDRFYKDIYLRRNSENKVEYQYEGRDRWIELERFLHILQLFMKQELGEVEYEDHSREVERVGD